MSKDPILYLHHILDCTNKILQYTQGFSEEDFLTNPVIQDATLRNFEIMGEATKQLPYERNTLTFPGEIWPGCAISSYMIILG